MLALSITVDGRRPLVAALDQDRCVIAATIEWNDREPGRKGRVVVTASGVDDREDHLLWFEKACSSNGVLEVEVVKATRGDPPVRQRRKSLAEWRALEKESTDRERRRIAELEKRLFALRSGAALRFPAFTRKPPCVGLRVSVNGRHLTTIGVGRPGVCSVYVYVRRRDGESVRLHLHGGERLSEGAWRWKCWPNKNRPLVLGDRVRVDIVSPRRVSRGQVSDITNAEPVTEKEIRAELDLRRKMPNSRLAADHLKWERERPRPRRYPR